MYQSQQYGFSKGWMAVLLAMGVPEDSPLRNLDQIPFSNPPPPAQNPIGAEVEEDTPRTGAGTSQAISNIISSKGSTISAKSQFSAASGDEAYPDGHILPAPNLRIFSFTELKIATKNFRPDTVLGEGGFGQVFNGWLEDKGQSKSGNGTVIAVKKLNSESFQGFQECQSEVNVLGRLSHPNLVKLLGYCQEDRELLLIYDFVQKGSLENHLFGRGSAVQPLPWDIQLKIAIGAARGLAFLHTSDMQVIHRDIKTSNILLDESYTAKISDFSLAKLGPSASQTHVTTRVMGTYGCAAPEYVATGHLYVKSDVYGFGVVLVEILTGLRALDTNRPKRSKLKQIMDSRLEGKYPSKAVFHISQLALKCLAAEPKHRPSMKEVLEKLERFEAANERPREPRSHASHPMVHREGQQPLHHRSPLHPRLDGSPAYQNSSRVR
ncbi:hypothetical protein ACJW31_07G164300 [Castanea mollissima]